jgi:hypothetical protein
MAAGLGFKTFTTGEVLTAANVNGYLMQGILVFATAAARDSAITSPQEGQACYLKDTDAVLTYSGSAWVAVGGAASFSGVKCSNTLSQSIPNNTYTAITWAGEEFDVGGYHSTATNTSRITIPAGKAGYYQLQASGGTGSSATGIRIAKIYKNGTSIVQTVMPGSTTDPNIEIETVVYLAVADYVEVFFYQNSGSSQTVYWSEDYGFFTAFLIGA